MIELKGIEYCEIHGDYKWFIKILENSEVWRGRLDERIKCVRNCNKVNNTTYVIETFCPECKRRKFVNKNIYE